MSTYISIRQRFAEVPFLFDYEWWAIDFLYQTILEIRAILLGSSYGATEACMLGYENERL